MRIRAGREGAGEGGSTGRTGVCAAWFVSGGVYGLCGVCWTLVVLWNAALVITMRKLKEITV